VSGERHSDSAPLLASTEALFWMPGAVPMTFDGILDGTAARQGMRWLAARLRRPARPAPPIRVVRGTPGGEDDHDFEPVPGLPARLPPGETLLWQGAPSAKALAIQAFHVRKVAAYFAVLLAADAINVGLTQGTHAIPAALAPGAGLTVLALAILAALAVFSARSCIYSITTRRVVMRYGVVLPMVMNIPFVQVASADLKVRPDGEGDIALRPLGPDRIAYFALWPHARPWKLSRPEPMLRCVPRVEQPAGILSRALSEAARAAAPQGEAAAPAAPVGRSPVAA